MWNKGNPRRADSLRRLHRETASSLGQVFGERVLSCTISPCTLDYTPPFQPDPSLGLDLKSRSLNSCAPPTSLSRVVILGMSAQKPTMTAKLTASALSLFTESTSSETTASRARSASSALTSLPPSPKKARRDESETPGHFRSPVKAGALPTPSTTSNGSQVATTAPAMRKPARRMARASMHRSTPDPHDDGKEYLVAGMYYSEPVIASSSSTSPPSELKRPARSASMRPRKDELNWRKMQQPSSFPLPIYHGAIMLEEERDFKLSFDVLRDGQATSRDGKGVKMCRKAEAQYDAVEREKLESSQKPPPYRSIPKSELAAPPPLRSYARSF